MGLMQLYSSLISRNSGKIIIGTTGSVLSLLLLTLIIKPCPSFKDPRVGFEARNTLISIRINTWNLLVDEVSASNNNLSLSPNSPTYEASFRFYDNLATISVGTNFNGANVPLEPPVIEMSTMDDKTGNHSASDVMDEYEEEYFRTINSSVSDMANLIHYSLDSDQAFCGQLFEGYAQITIGASPKETSRGLLNLQSMLAICQLDHQLRLEHSPQDKFIFQLECERFQLNNSSRNGTGHPGMDTACCNSWSLPNYIACLTNHTSCFSITSTDMKTFENLLHLCTPYYHRFPFEECFVKQKDGLNDGDLSSYNTLGSNGFSFDKIGQSRCGLVPDKCVKCGGWTYHVMHFLVNHNFMLSSNDSTNEKNIHRHEKLHNSRLGNSPSNRLNHTNIFLPIAKSPSLMRYYQAITKYNLRLPSASVKAMNLGLKVSLFEEFLINDAKLFGLALLAILIIITCYTWSIILSMVILLIICLSLCLSFVIYQVILDIPVFPFINLLAIVISFGICSDNAMLFCKHWNPYPYEVDEIETNESTNNANFAPDIPSSHINDKPPLNTDYERAGLDRMLGRAVIGTFVATLATACSFIISAISRITAIRCFCIFATLSVITNYLLIVLLLPPALIVDSRISNFIRSRLNNLSYRQSHILARAHHAREQMIERGKIFNHYMMKFIDRFKLYLIVTFLTLLCCSSILVFYKPTLQPADEDYLQLLTSRHEFEQYDKHLKKHFAFERSKEGNLAYGYVPISGVNSLPIRVIFGLVPKDDGNFFDSHERGTLEFDRNFDLADKDSQTWMLQFCKRLREHKYINSTTRQDWSSCFIEAFKTWMEKRTCHDPIQPEVDRSPCCQAYEFPFHRSVFDRCIGEAVDSIRKTPQSYPNYNAGIRFFKNSTRVAALVVEYRSNRLFSKSFVKMDRFYNEVDEWVQWQVNNTAPPSLKSGWFVSANLDLLALQTELMDGTTTSIILEVLFAMIALMLGTRDLITTLLGGLAISTVVITTIGCLLIFRWTLGITESIMISLTIGLSMDFALHYAIEYNDRKNNGSNNAIIHSVLDRVGGPIALATMTTSLAGFVVIWSNILAYQKLGTFLILVAVISWTTSTFFLLPMLALFRVLRLMDKFHSTQARY